MNLKTFSTWKNKMQLKAQKPKYVKKDPISHILSRSDMYVGSTRSRKVEEYVVTDNSYHIEKKNIEVSPAILRIFIEPLSNIIDNVARSKQGKNKVTKISIEIDEETGKTSLWNDGDVIPIEMHEDEKCYNHTMIFGHLLTSSNYNDEEDREDISGRNGLGVKLCLKKGTLIPTFSGDILPIEDIKIGDKLIGDDGLSRTVTGKTQGFGALYEVTQSRGKPYTVNENHIITLKMLTHKLIFWDFSKKCWKMRWVNSKEKKIDCKYIFVKNSDCKVNSDLDKIKAKEQLKLFANTITDDNTIEISIKDYMSLPRSAQNLLTGFFGNCVEWPEKEVSLDPYLLGLWLGNGTKSGYCIAVNKEKDPEIFDYLSKWGKNNNTQFTQVHNDEVCYFYFISDANSTLKKLLEKYQLIGYKHIPKEYLVNSRKIRLSVLAGIIDSIGDIKYNDKQIVITQSICNERLSNDILFMVKSLGFRCTSYVKKSVSSEDENSIVIRISGGDTSDIPNILPRKKWSDPLSKYYKNTGFVKVRCVQNGDFVGLEVDRNHRFVLEDFTVTHNCNIFSTEFTVEGADPENSKHFKQIWKNNMREPSEPEIKSYKKTKGYTKVTFTPDFKYFGIDGYTKDILSLYRRFVVDTAMITKVPVFLNDEEIPVSTLVDYAKLYSKEETETLTIKTKECEVVVSPSKNEFQAISFANGVYTPLGGTHVDAWVEAIFRPLVEKLNKPKKPQVNIGEIKKYFKLFVVATVKKPEFDSQSKTKLESPQIEAEVKKTHISTICKWSVMEMLEDIIRAKEMVVLKKSERKKRGYEKVEGLDPANNEGTSKGHECTLILVEGLSAKTYASWGIQRGAFGKKGRDWFGIYALRGKVLNCRNSKPLTISKNNVVTDIIKALGIQYGVDYSVDENFHNLRYGRVLIVTDADVDGLHISGLIQNMFHALFPTLLQRNPPFITSMQTPIVRVFQGKSDILFYDEQEYRKYVRDNLGKKINKKYYKGLGSSNEEDVSETFGQKLVEFQDDENTFENMNKAFNTKYADNRKEWLEQYDPNNVVLKWDGNKQEKHTITFSDYINTELIKFSLDDCKRSIPNLMDGLKEGHRKVLYVAFKRNLKYSGKTIKVAQLAGSVSEKAGYHHGEKNLETTMTNMANSYVGSNNIPLLFRDGQFGSRAEGGKDAAAGRYIWTKLDAMTRLLFREEDDVLLEHIEDDGDKVEPRFYVPIIPTILVNGCIGIGTGWSSSVPCYNPLDLISSIKTWLDNNNQAFDTKDGVTISLLPELKPWYRGHNGEMTSEGNGNFTSWGCVNIEKGKAHVTELPVGLWTSDFVENLEAMKEEKEILNYKNHSTPKDISFIITESTDGISCNAKNLKLHKPIRTTNMVLFTEQGNLKKFSSPEEIIDAFCGIRFSYYVKRKAKQLKDLERDIKMLGNKKRFLQEVRDGVFKLFEELKGGKKQSRKTSDIVLELEEKGYDKYNKNEEEEQQDDSDEKKNVSIHGYEYLLRMQISSITAEKIEKLIDDISNKEEAHEKLSGITEKELWINDLNEFEEAYLKWLPIINSEKHKKRKNNTE